MSTLEGAVALQVDPDIKGTILPARVLPVALQEPVKQETECLVELNVLERVTKHMNWVSHLVAASKADGLVRLCIDPQHLNKALKRERYHPQPLRK